MPTLPKPPEGDYLPGRRPPEGLSLLEVVVTIAVLTGVALGAALLLAPMARQARINRETSIANVETQRVLEELQAAPLRDIVALYPQGSVRPIPQLPGGSLRVSYVDPAADPLVVDVELTWNSPDLGSMQRSFHTIRTE
jgi:Tfp pilus assembly protein PilV